MNAKKNEKKCTHGDLNPQPLELQSNALPTALPTAPPIQLFY